MTRALPAALLLAASGVASATELEVGYGHEVLTRGAPWRELALAAAWGQPGAPRVDLAVRDLERFGLRDTELRASASGPLGPSWTVAGEASASPEHRFAPAFGAGASLQRTLGSGLVASAGVRWSSYVGDAGATDAGLGTLGLERYWSAFRLGWSGYVATLRGEWILSNAAAWDLYYGREDRVGVRVAAGREIAGTVGGEPISSSVLAAGITGRHGLGGEWALTYDAGIMRQGDLYTRTGARLGLRRHF